MEKRFICIQRIKRDQFLQVLDFRRVYFESELNFIDFLWLPNAVQMRITACQPPPEAPWHPGKRPS